MLYYDSRICVLPKSITIGLQIQQKENGIKLWSMRYKGEKTVNTAKDDNDTLQKLGQNVNTAKDHDYRLQLEQKRIEENLTAMCYD